MNVCRTCFLSKILIKPADFFFEKYKVEISAICGLFMNNGLIDLHENCYFA